MDGIDEPKAPLQSGQNEMADTVNPSNDPADKLTPEHPRFKQVLEERNEYKKTTEELKAELSELKELVLARQTETNSSEFTSDELAAIEKIDKALKSRGYLTKDVLDATNSQQKTAMQLEKMENKYDGSNGYPKFDPSEVLAYSRKKGISDLEDAYFSLHRQAIIQVEAKRESPQVPTSEKPTKADKPSPLGEISPQDLKEMSLGEWEQKRERILASLKPR